MSIQPTNNLDQEKAQKAVAEELKKIGIDPDSIDLTSEEAQEAIKQASVLATGNKSQRKKVLRKVQRKMEASTPNKFHQLTSVYDKKFAAENQEKISKVYDDFDEDNANPKELAEALEREGIHAHISDNYHLKAKYGAGQSDDVAIVLAYFHQPLSVKVNDERMVLDNFTEELVVPKSFVPEPEEDDRPLPKKSLFKRMFSKDK